MEGPAMGIGCSKGTSGHSWSVRSKIKIMQNVVNPTPKILISKMCKELINTYMG